MSRVENWYETQFLPWKKQAEQAQEQQHQQRLTIAAKANQIKYLAALLYDGKLQQAKELWNQLELGPKLKGLTQKGNTLVVTLEDGSHTALTLEDMARQFTAELQKL